MASAPTSTTYQGPNTFTGSTSSSYSSANPAQPGIDNQAAQNAARSIIANGQALAEQIDPTPRSSGSSGSCCSHPTIIHGYGSPWWYSPWYQPVYIFPDNSRRQDNSGERALVGIIMTLIIGFGSLALGAAVSRLMDARNELYNALSNRDQLDRSDFAISSRQYQQLTLAKEVADIETSICNRIANSALIDVVLRAGLVVSAVFGLISAFAFIHPAYMSIALITGIAFGAIMLFKAGLENTEHRNVADTRHMRDAIGRYNALNV